MSHTVRTVACQGIVPVVTGIVLIITLKKKKGNGGKEMSHTVRTVARDRHCSCVAGINLMTLQGNKTHLLPLI